MKNEQVSKLNKIHRIERAILRLESYSPVIMGNMLSYLQNQRIEYHAFLCQSQDNPTSALQHEYKEFCDFIYNLILSKRFSRATLAETMRSFVGDYEYLFPFDIDKSSYEYTIKTLGKLEKAYLNCKNIIARNCGVGVMKKSARMFEKYYGASQKTETIVSSTSN